MSDIISMLGHQGNACFLSCQLLSTWPAFTSYINHYISCLGIIDLASHCKGPDKEYIGYVVRQMALLRISFCFVLAGKR